VTGTDNRPPTHGVRDAGRRRSGIAKAARTPPEVLTTFGHGAAHIDVDNVPAGLLRHPGGLRHHRPGSAAHSAGPTRVAGPSAGPSAGRTRGGWRTSASLLIISVARQTGARNSAGADLCGKGASCDARHGEGAGRKTGETKRFVGTDFSRGYQPISPFGGAKRRLEQQRDHNQQQEDGANGSRELMKDRKKRGGRR